MFVDLTEAERQRFLSQGVCHIPGYTGHCPTMRFRYGHTFGADSATILEHLRDISPVCKDPNYRDHSWQRGILSYERVPRAQQDPLVSISTPQRPYVLGYTGYIPGLNFQYGSSFSQLADKSMKDFTTRLAQQEQQRANERLEFINTKPQLASIRGKDNVTETLHHYSRFNKLPEIAVNSEKPPIAGYTGHIPRLRASEISLSQTYHSAAQTGLTLLNEEKYRRKQLDAAKEAIHDAISYSHVH